jgi:membrane-associated phospholipid phosphatase
MRIARIITNHFSATSQPRVSPVSGTACFMTFVLLVVGIATSIATGFQLASLPNIVLLIIGILVVDVLLIHFAPRIRIVDTAQAVLYGVLYLAVTSVCAVLAAYSLQRLGFPMRDQFLENADVAMGLSWFDYAHWVDKHRLVQTILHGAYYSIWPQTILPVLLLPLLHRLDEARIYILAFAVALTLTIFISALMPAIGPIVFFDRSAFHVLRFTGATPFEQLMRLREVGPLIQNAFPGGIATFPSFHATMAILTPLAFRAYPRIFAALVILNVAMLGSTVTEGAHYFIDIVAGIVMAFFAYLLAKRVIGMEDRLLQYRWASRPQAIAHAPAGEAQAAAAR